MHAFVPLILSLGHLTAPLIEPLPPAPLTPATRIVDKVSAELAADFTQTLDYIATCSHGNEAVMETAGLFLSDLSTTYSRGEGWIECDVRRILVGVQFAAEKHRFQTRKDSAQTPYIIHPIGVAHHMLTVGRVRDPDILIAALLHDTVEDTDTHYSEILDLFGHRVTKFVHEVTDNRALSKAERKKLQLEMAPYKSAGAAQIKLADKFYNLNDLLKCPPPDWDKSRVDEYFNWAEAVVHALPWVNAALKNAVDQTIAAYRNGTV